MNNDNWNEIKKDYDTAYSCLCCPKDCDFWHRENDKGLYHLWKAYYNSQNTDSKDNLTYARILMLMNHETQMQVTEYDRLKKFIEPAHEAFVNATKTGNPPTAKEMEYATDLFNSMSYTINKETFTHKNYEQSLSIIENHELLSEYDFGFYDSKPVYFEHTDKHAILKLRYDEITCTLRFDELYEISVHTDPVVDWIGDFCCYQLFHDKTTICFDIGIYKIICKKIAVTDISVIRS